MRLASSRSSRRSLRGDRGGELKIVRLLDPFAMLWIRLMARRNQGRNFAFSVLRR
jgi:hypothetical protein